MTTKHSKRCCLLQWGRLEREGSRSFSAADALVCPCDPFLQWSVWRNSPVIVERMIVLTVVCVHLI